MNMFQDDEFSKRLKSYTNSFHPVVNFNPANEKIISFDLTENNEELKGISMEDMHEFQKYIFEKLKQNNAKFGYGGYDELRFLYNRSDLFNNNLAEESIGIEEPRATAYRYRYLGR